MPAAERRPIVLPCHGVSARGVAADEVAERLAARGLAEVVDDIEAIVAAARDGREVIALDGCAGSCQARLLDAHGVETLRSLNLETAGEASEATSVDELEAATQDVKRARRPLPAAGELAAHRGNLADDYLLALDTLTSRVSDCGSLVEAPTLAAHVAQALGVARPTAGETLARLEQAGLVERSRHKELYLTPQGRSEADRARRKHRILEVFAARMLGYEVDECYERAHELAPGFTDEALERAWTALGTPDRCPHGWPIDPAEALATSRGLVALTAAASGGDYAVDRLDELNPPRLRALVAAGLEPGAAIEAVDVDDAAGTVSFRVGGETRSIGLGAARAVFVRPAA
jgi:DtxR family Mn-dependent transcriptional regulator